MIDGSPAPFTYVYSGLPVVPRVQNLQLWFHSIYKYQYNPSTVHNNNNIIQG